MELHTQTVRMPSVTNKIKEICIYICIRGLKLKGVKTIFPRLKRKNLAIFSNVWLKITEFRWNYLFAESIEREKLRIARKLSILVKKLILHSIKRYFFQDFMGGGWLSRPLAFRWKYLFALIGDPLYLNVSIGMSKTNKQKKNAKFKDYVFRQKNKGFFKFSIV